LKSEDSFYLRCGMAFVASATSVEVVRWMREARSRNEAIEPLAEKLALDRKIAERTMLMNKEGCWTAIADRRGSNRSARKSA
jgi:hypothetical protein